VGVVALDELLDAQLVRPTNVPRRFAFRHPLVRRAVYESSKGGWRLVAHARAAAALAAQGASPTARAHHIEQAAIPGDDDAIAVLLAAGAADAPRAPASAAHWYSAALRLIPETDAPGRLRTLISLAQAAQSTGDLERSAAVLLDAIALVPADDVALRLRLISMCAACENFLGRHDSADQRLVAAIDTLPDQRLREAAGALLDLASGAFFTLDDERMCALAERGLAIARGIGEPGLRANAAAVYAHACATAGLAGRAGASADEASAVFDAMPDDALASHLGPLNRLAWAEYLIERFDDSLRHADRGVAVARATGQGQFIPLMLSAQALSATSRGALETAVALQDEAVEAAELAANDYVSSSVLTAAAAVVRATGDLETVRRLAESAVACVAGVESGRMAAMARARLAVTLRELGDSAPATEALVAAAGGWELPSITPAWRVLYMEGLTRVEIDGDRLDAAAACADVAESAAAGLGLPLATAIAERARATVLLAEDRPAAALALASAHGAELAGAPVEAARSRLLAGRALVAAGERTRAVELLRLAEHELDEHGALRDRGEARRELRKLGARAEPRGPSGAPGGGFDSLSRREREVAILITERKTNKEVAGELFLSEKTVESHLRNIFTKLGASSRVDVARVVERRDR
jgi:DNA-binding NarL/FixJ family response regulator